MQTWTYNPQKRQDGSAFALTYILRLRSCRFVDVFLISSLPPFVDRRMTRQLGPFTPRALPRFTAHTDPSATLSPSARLPGVAGYTAYLFPSISRRDEEGFSSCSACPCHRAAASTPPEWMTASVSLRSPLLPSPYGCGLGLRGYSLSRPLLRSFALRPSDSLTILKMALSMGFRVLVSLHPAIQATELLTFTLAGLTPAEHASLSWTHIRT